jgi:hypothetical protein
MESEINLQERMGKNTIDFVFLEQCALAALFNKKPSVKVDNLENLSEMVIYSDIQQKRWGTSQEGPDIILASYKIKAVMAEDGKVNLLLEHTEGMRYIAYLCDTPKRYIGDLTTNELISAQIF